MLLTTRLLLSLRDHGPAVLALIDGCSLHRPQLMDELERRCPMEDDPLAPEKVALAISNHGRLHRGEPGWEWYDRWCAQHDELAFVNAVVDYCALPLPPPGRRAHGRVF
jgi:hypothetical protein